MQDACQHGLIVYDAHREWHREHGTEESYQTVKQLLLRCSQLGMSFGLEQGYHELPGVKKGVVYHEPPHDDGVNDAAEQGARYYQGKGVPRDFGRAFDYLKIAADGGHVLSRYGLGMVFFRGEGTKADSAMALRWFLKAAEGGLAQAQQEVSVFFCNGVGCQADPAKAFYWCQKAADQNVVEAVYNLGVFLHRYRCFGQPGQGSRVSKRSREPGARRGQIHFVALAYRPLGPRRCRPLESAFTERGEA